MKLQYIIYFLILIVTLSCDQDQEIDFKYNSLKSPQLVLHGFISPNTGVQVNLDRTIDMNSNKKLFIEDATVSLYKDGAYFTDLIEKDTGFYVFEDVSLLDQNSSYQIYASAPGFEQVYSSDQYILPEVIIDSLALVKDTIENSGYSLRFYFNDDQNRIEYYKVIYNKFTQPVDSLVLWPDGSFILTSSKAKTQSCCRIVESIEYYSRYKDPDTVYVTGYLINISEDFHRFTESLDDYYYTREDIFFPVTSPVYSNINGGYGIFGSYTSSSKILILKNR